MTTEIEYTRKSKKDLPQRHRDTEKEQDGKDKAEKSKDNESGGVGNAEQRREKRELSSHTP